MNKFKRSLKILSSALVTMLIFYGMYGIFASAEDYEFETPSLGFDIVRTNYHDAMNDYFNKKIELFLETEPESEEYVIPAEGEECGEKNVSTYCVAMGALDMYYAYSDTLDEIAPTILQIQAGSAPVTGNLPGTVASLFSSFSINESKVAEEKTTAMKAMDMTVSAYNELRLAYPVHLKYELIIKELHAYIANLRALRYTMYSFPGKFIDSSSQACK